MRIPELGTRAANAQPTAPGETPKEVGAPTTTSTREVNRFERRQRPPALALRQQAAVERTHRRSAVDVRTTDPEIEDDGGELVAPLPTIDHRKAKDVELVAIEGPLFDGEPSGIDGAQGEVGDCFELAPFLATAGRRPELIKQCFEEIGPNRWRVTIWGKDENDQPVKRSTEVDNKFWVDKESKEPTYAKGRELGDGKRVLWLMLFEKAMTVLYPDDKGPKKPSYTSIDGGYEANTLFALTGFEAEQTIFNTDLTAKEKRQRKRETAEVKAERIDAVAQRAWDRLVAGFGDGGVVVMGTPGEAGTEHDPEMNKLGICGGHVYSAFDIKEEDGQRFVLMQNPWLSFEPGDTDPEAEEDQQTPADGKEDGRFWWPIEKLVEVFQDMHIGRTKPKPDEPA